MQKHVNKKAKKAVDEGKKDPGQCLDDLEKHSDSWGKKIEGQGKSQT